MIRRSHSEGIDWGDYEPYVPLHEGLLHELSRRNTRAEFQHLMAEKSDRIYKLKALLLKNGVSLAQEVTASVQALNDWFVANVEKDRRTPDRLMPIWYSVVNDIALYLGELLISKHASLEWSLHMDSKRDFSYQRHVIAGFSRAAQGYCADIDIAVATYGHQIVTGVEVDPRYFVSIIEFSDNIA